MARLCSVVFKVLGFASGQESSESRGQAWTAALGMRRQYKQTLIPKTYKP